MFQGDWMDKFDKKATECGDFFMDSTSKANVSMMHQTREFKYVGWIVVKT